MASKPKTYVASPGFYDQAIAAPSMKAALEAWGADSNLFHQGVAKETYDPEIVAATMAQSGVILKRPVGSNAAFGDFRPSYRSGSSRERKLRASIGQMSVAGSPPVTFETGNKSVHGDVVLAEFDRGRLHQTKNAPSRGVFRGAGARTI